MSVQFIEDLSEAELQLVELEENVRRTDLTWQEECEAIAHYHELCKTKDDKWTVEKTAESLKFSTEEVREKINVNKELKKPESRVHKADKFSVARNIVRRQTARAAESELSAFEPEQENTVPLLNVDFNEWARSYTGPKFNFIHCDFPYGIDFGNSPRQNSDNVSLGDEYADGANIYWTLLDTLAESMSNVVAESAHLMFWFSMNYYQQTRKQLADMGWTVNPFPLIWHKSDNAGIIPDVHRGPRRTYETAFIALRGDRKIVQPIANSFSAPTTKRIHPSEKNEQMLAHFFRLFVDDNTTLLDPTCGSGGAIRVGKMAGAVRTLGLERDPNFYQQAKEHFDDD